MPSSIRLRATASLVAINLALLLSSAAVAQQRAVSVNGVWLGPEQLAVADMYAGYRLPDGNYWYDAASGYWGVVGGPVLGQVPPAAATGGNQSWYHAGPGGYTGSNGSCSYYFDPQTGSSVMSGGC